LASGSKIKTFESNEPIAAASPCRRMIGGHHPALAQFSVNTQEILGRINTTAGSIWGTFISRCDRECFDAFLADVPHCGE
jgi:hypothetical protein